MTYEDAAELEEMRLRRVEIARGLKYHRQHYTAEDMLIAREPNEAGFFASHPHDGGLSGDGRPGKPVGLGNAALYTRYEGMEDGC